MGFEVFGDKRDVSSNLRTKRVTPRSFNSGSNVQSLNHALEVTVILTTSLCAKLERYISANSSSERKSRSCFVTCLWASKWQNVDHSPFSSQRLLHICDTRYTVVTQILTEFMQADALVSFWLLWWDTWLNAAYEGKKVYVSHCFVDSRQWHWWLLSSGDDVLSWIIPSSHGHGVGTEIFLRITQAYLNTGS